MTSDGGSEVTERFTALCYAGQLCSTAFGYSKTAGKVFSSNALFPKNLDTRFVGKYEIKSAPCISQLLKLHVEMSSIDKFGIACVHKV